MQLDPVGAISKKFRIQNWAIHGLARSVQLVIGSQVVVLTDVGLEEAKRVDSICHSVGIAFIHATTRGVFASVFTDFGPSFTVVDVDGASGALLLCPQYWAACT
jgi:hypothetical protein